MDNLRPLINRFLQFYRANPRRNNKAALAAVLVTLFMTCLCISCAQSYTPSGRAASTQRAADRTATSAMRTDARAGTDAARTATAGAPTRTPLPTSTRRPTNTTQPTSTRRPPSQEPPMPVASLTRTPLPTCDCSRDYNCDDFSSHARAQACFNNCGGSASYNFAGLDSDGNGLACESLP